MRIVRYKDKEGTGGPAGSVKERATLDLRVGFEPHVECRDS